MTYLDDITEAVRQANVWLAGHEPKLAIVLGSGWGGILDALEDSDAMDYRRLPGFPPAGVEGHAGRLHRGRLFGIDALVFEGRYHCYEGYDAWQVSAPVRLAAGTGCEKILLTNAAGGIADVLNVGDFMLVTDHLNLTSINPLGGRPERMFIDLSRLYADTFYSRLKEALSGKQIGLERGVLAWMPGPSYETPAEIKALEIVGADAVSMSTIPEAIVARRAGLEVAALSLISNMAAGKAVERLDHEDVLRAGKRAGRDALTIVQRLLPLWIKSSGP